MYYKKSQCSGFGRWTSNGFVMTPIQPKRKVKEVIDLDEWVLAGILLVLVLGLIVVLGL